MLFVPISALSIKNPGFCAIQLRIIILLKSFPILFILIFFINFHPYFNSYISSCKNILVLDPTFA